MNRTDLIQALADSGVQEAEKAVNKMIDILTVSLAAGEPVSIRNFGKLQPKKRAAIVRKNPKSGIPLDIPGRNTVTFSPSPALKARLNRT